MMFSRDHSRKLGLPHGAIVVLLLLAAGGVLLSLYSGQREAGQYRALERLRLTDAIDAHFGKLADHLAARENLAGIVASLFDPPPLSAPRPLGRFGEHVIALAPEIATAGWLPETPPSRAGEALRSLAESGVSDPQFKGPGGIRVVPEGLDRPLYPILDIVPPKNRFVLGVDAGAFPDRLAAIERARDSKDVVRTDPLPLVQSPNSNAILLYAPVFSDGRFRGVMGFGYQVESLFRTAVAAAPLNHAVSLRVHQGNAAEPIYSAAGSDGAAPRAATEIERETTFGTRPLRIVYSVPRDLGYEGFWRGFGVASIGLLLTATAVTLLGFMANRTGALAREVRSRRSAEDRLKVLIHELNHRVRNVMSVAQAIVRLSFTAGASLPIVQKTCEGRLQALANAMTLLTASDWKNIGIRSLITEDILPFSERIETIGPDLSLSARAAQTIALLLHELATNAVKHGALSVRGGKVRLSWQVERGEGEPVFRLQWQESGGPDTRAPTHRGFGELLVKRIAPRDLAGRGTAHYEAPGFRYELEAPLSEITRTEIKEDAA